MTPSRLLSTDHAPQTNGRNAPPDRRARFEALYERDSRELWACAYAACMDGGAAMHCVQVAFEEAWDRMDTGEDQSAWLRGRVRALASVAANGNGRAHAEGQVDNAAALGAIRPLLAALPAEAREVLTLRYALDYGPERIATVLGARQGDVERQLATHKKALADALGSEAVL